MAKSRLIVSGACPRCRELALPFASAVSLGLYQGELRQAVLRMKRPAGEALLIAMSHLLIETQQQRLQEFRISWRRIFGFDARSRPDAQFLD